MRAYSNFPSPNRELPRLKAYDTADSVHRCIGCGSPNWFLADGGGHKERQKLRTALRRATEARA